MFEPEAVAPQTTALTLAAGESLSFWNSLDLTYQTDTTLNFVITVQPEAQAPIEILCDALNPTSEFMTTTITTVMVASKQRRQLARRRSSAPQFGASFTEQIIWAPSARSP